MDLGNCTQENVGRNILIHSEFERAVSAYCS